MNDLEETSTIEIPEKLPKQFPWFQPFMCEGCNECVLACPNHCIELVCLNRQVPPAWMVRPDDCIGCGKCEKACLSQAVQMTKYVEKAYVRYKEKKTPYDC
ncbi:MAG: NADH-quinone oxidoreductase subunit I [Promethearchaeota archaeon]